MLSRFTRVSLSFLLLSSALAAQVSQDKKPDSAAAKATCSIAGIVVKLGTSEPLKKADVYLEKEDDPISGYSALTDAAGHFAIQKIDPGRYWLRVEHAGYVTESYGSNSSSSRGAVLTLNPGKEIQDLLFRMVPSAVISGRITDEDGDPVVDAQVEALRLRFSEGKRTFEPVASAQTNDLGEYRLYRLAKGRYFVRAQIGERWQRSLQVSSADDPGATAQTGYAPVYYPGTPDQARAATIEVASGQEVPAVDFNLISTRTFRIRGQVFDAALGQPAKDCWIFLQRHEPSLSIFSNQRVQTDCNKGAFELNDLIPGSYSLLVTLSSSEKQHSARATVEVGNTNVDDIRIVVGAGITLTGRVLVEGHQRLDFSEVSIWLYDPELSFISPPGAKAKPDGSLKFENVLEGTYQLRVWGRPPDYSPDFYLKSARANGEDILEKGLTVGAGTTRGPLEIVLSSAGTRIEGTVTDENDLPFAGAVVALVPEGERRTQIQFYKDTTTDQYGAFLLRGVAPGNYEIYSWQEVESGAWEDPDFLAPFEPLAAKITAEENGHLTLRLKLIPAEKSKQSP